MIKVLTNLEQKRFFADLEQILNRSDFYSEKCFEYPFSEFLSSFEATRLLVCRDDDDGDDDDDNDDDDDDDNHDDDNDDDDDDDNHDDADDDNLPHFPECSLFNIPAMSDRIDILIKKVQGLFLRLNYFLSTKLMT